MVVVMDIRGRRCVFALLIAKALSDVMKYGLPGTVPQDVSLALLIMTRRERFISMELA